MVPCAMPHAQSPLGRIPLRPVPALYSWHHGHVSGLFLTPDIDIIELNHAPERVPGIPILRGLANLMAPTLGRGIRDT